MLDSVFSPLLSQFQQEEEEIPYADDEPILGRKEITDEQNKIEDKFSNLLTAAAWSETDKYLKRIEPFLKNSDRTSIEKEKWAIAVPMQGLLYGLWSESWSLGEDHAVRELNIKNSKVASQKSRFQDSLATCDLRLATFKDEPVYLAYPPDYGIPLSASVLRQAVEQRTLKLANDVTDQTAARIQSYVLDAVDKHTPAGVPPDERKLLVRRINGILGRQRQEESDRDLPKDERVKTTIRTPGANAFHKRARVIASTELSAAYSLGRLQVYIQAGVKKVRWQALGDLKTCPLCRSRNGTIHELDTLLAQHQFANRGIYDPVQYIIPCHPLDRCHWQPVLDDIDDEDNKRSRDSGRNPTLRQIVQLRQAWSLAGTVINVASAVSGVVQRQRQEAEQKEKQRQQQTRRLLFLGGAAALSLAALYVLLRQQDTIQPQPQPQPQPQSQQTSSILEEVASQAVEGLLRQQIPPERSLVPQNLLPQNILRQYPQLRSVPNVQNLSVEDLVRLGVSRTAAPQLQQVIQKAIRDASTTDEAVTERTYPVPTPRVQQPVIQGVGRAPQLLPTRTGLPSTPKPSLPSTSTPALSIPTSLGTQPSSNVSPFESTAIIRPRRYQPPIVRDGSIIVGSQELRQQENRDRIMRGIETVEQQVVDYQFQLASVVRNARRPGSKKNAPKLGTQIQSAGAKQQDALRKATAARGRLNTSAAQSQNALPELEQATTQVERLLEDFSDPLSAPYFNKAGNLSAGAVKEIQRVEKEIDNTLNEIAYNLSTPEREAQRLSPLIDELSALRRDSIEVLQNVSAAPGSPMSAQKFELLQNLQRQLDEVSQVRAVDVGDEFFRDVQQTRDRLTGLLQSQADLARSDVVARIDGQIANVENAIARSSRARNSGALSTLVDTRDGLIALRQRLTPNNLPRKISDLSPERQAAWNATQEARSRIQASTANLNRNLENYRRRTRFQVDQIRTQSEKFNSIAQDLEVVQDDGLTLYQQERQAAIASNQNLLAEAFNTLDNNLNQLRMVASPDFGIRYVMQNIPEVLEDLPDPTVSTLGFPRRNVPRGLDEAVEVRRTAIDTLKNRLDYEPPEGKSNFGDINRVERILDYDSPRQATKTRIAAVEQEIAAWENLRTTTALNSNRYAAAIRADLEALRQADPIAYAEAKPQKILQEIEYNTAFQTKGFEQRIARLRVIREQLRQDMATPVSYQVRPNQNLRVSELRKELSKIREEVQRAGRTRRAELENVWGKVVDAGADADAIALHVKAFRRKVVESRGRLTEPGRGLTSGIKGSNLTLNQRRLLASLSDDEWQILVDSVESGAFDLYKDLGRLSVQKAKWEQLAQSKWDEIQDKLRELESRYGYRVVLRQEPDGSLSYVSRLGENSTGRLAVEDLEDIETNPNRFKKGGRKPGNLLAQIRGLTGIGSRARVDLDDPRNYVDIQATLAQNAEERIAIGRRLELLNFNQKLKLAEFRRGKLLRSRKSWNGNRDITARESSSQKFSYSPFDFSAFCIPWQEMNI